MSGRSSEQYAYAFDEHGKEYLIYEEYRYSNGCGYYHSCIGINGQEFESEFYIEDEEPATSGTMLPNLKLADMQSYFTANTSSNIQEVLSLNELADVNIAAFLDIWVDSVLAGPYDAACHIITKNGIFQHEHDVSKESLGDDVETVVKNLLDKHAPKNI